MLHTSHRRLALAAVNLCVMIALPAAGQTINENAKLLPTDGAASDEFGRSVAISGTTAVVGAWHDDDNGDASGSAYIFDTTTGLQIAKLLPNDGAEVDRFGCAVAICGTTAVIGAYSDDDAGESSGSAYLFDTTTGQQIAKLLPNDGAGGDLFGYAVAISGTTVVVGAYGDDDNGTWSGSAYLFDTTTGQQIAKLLPSDGAVEDCFGESVAISGTTALVGADDDGDNGSNSGSVYLFDTTTGQQIAKLLPDDGAAGDHFGGSVAISGTTAVVGARSDYHNGQQSGSAYLFDTTTGQQIAKLLASDGAELDWFGYAVAISGDKAIIGAMWDDDNGLASGAAYRFDTNTGQQIAKLLPSDGAMGNQLGVSVATSGTTAVVGAWTDSDNGNRSGSAYLFGEALDPGLDCNQNGVLDSRDIKIDPSLDCDLNGILDSCEIGPELDCNLNGVIDSCDIAVDPALDCDANGVIDSCEIPGFSADTGIQGPIGSNAPLTLTIPNALEASTDLWVRVTLSGDFAAQTQIALFSVNGQQLDVSYLPYNEPFFAGEDSEFDCASQPTVFEFMVPADLYNTGQIAGEATLEVFAPASTVSIDACPNGVSRIEAQYFYKDAPNDCNGNGTPDLCDLILFGGTSEDTNSNFIPDECETTACSSDLNDDGVLNFFDVSAFLAAYGNMDPVADFTDDGVFDFFDVSAFLSAFIAGCP